jgi:hypothetical protein
MGWLALSYPPSLSNLIFPTAVIFMSGSVTFTQCFGKSMRLFPERAGTASALMGTLFIAGSALAGFAGSFLETHTGVPLGLSFIVLTLFAAVIQQTLKLSRDGPATESNPASHS